MQECLDLCLASLALCRLWKPLSCYPRCNNKYSRIHAANAYYLPWYGFRILSSQMYISMLFVGPQQWFRAAACINCYDPPCISPPPECSARPPAVEACAPAHALTHLPDVLLQHVRAACVQVGEPLSQKLLLFDGLTCRFRSVRLRPRSADCIACGGQPSITAASLPSYDYTAFTGQSFDDLAPPPLQLLPHHQRMSAAQLAALLRPCGKTTDRPAGGCRHPEHAVQLVDLQPQEQDEQEYSGRGSGAVTSGSLQHAWNGSVPAPVLLVDTRPQEQFQIAHLPGGV